MFKVSKMANVLWYDHNCKKIEIRHVYIDALYLSYISIRAIIKCDYIVMHDVIPKENEIIETVNAECFCKPLDVGTMTIISTDGKAKWGPIYKLSYF